MKEFVTIEKIDGYARLKLNQPEKANAYNAEQVLRRQIHRQHSADRGPRARTA